MTSTDTTDLAQVDLLDPKWFADGPPHELFARMRAEAPVRWNALPGGSGVWSLTRHADISAVSKDTDTFSSWRAGVFLNPDQVIPLDLTRNLLLFKDPPEHTKYRMILQRRFTPKVVAALAAPIRDAITRTIDAVIEQGSCDFVTDIAVPVPLRVLAMLMGVPESDIPYLLEFTNEIEEAQRSPEPAAAMETFVKLGAYLHEQITIQAERGDEDSIVMQLRKGEVEGEQLDDAEILMFFGLLVFAGNDTTRNTSSSGMLALLQHPDQLQALRDDRSLIPRAVEEILRYTSVVNYFVRTATRSAEVAGQPIAEGEKVMMWYASASRDEVLFEDPDRFDIRRGSTDHKAFGGGGRHFCMGNSLARLVLTTLFEELTRRMDRIEPAGPVTRVPSSWTNSLTSLPITFAPGPREALS
jgi:cytochrome P450